MSGSSDPSPGTSDWPALPLLWNEKCVNWGPCDSHTTTLAKKNRYSREIHEVDLQFDHVISCDIERRFDIDATRGISASRVALQIEIDVA